MASISRLTFLMDRVFPSQCTQQRHEANELAAALATLGSHVDSETPTTDPHERGRVWLDGDTLKVSAG